MSIHPISDDFDWAEDDSIIFHAQPATAVYTNRHGDVVIRQLGEDEETFVFVRPENAQALCQAIMAEVQHELSESTKARAPEPKRLPPPTAGRPSTSAQAAFDLPESGGPSRGPRA
jgi:hypothetical protein